MDYVLPVSILLIAYFFKVNREGYKENKMSKVDYSNINEHINNDIADPYRLKKSLLDEYEKRFYLVLKMAFQENEYVIMIKVQSSEVFEVIRADDYNNNYYKLMRRNIDFIICDKHSMQPKYLIDLEDTNQDIDSSSLKGGKFHATCKTLDVGYYVFKKYHTYTVTDIKRVLGIY